MPRAPFLPTNPFSGCLKISVSGAHPTIARQAQKQPENLLRKQMNNKPLKPASLKRRLLALIYESLLVGSVTILSGMVIGAFNTIVMRMFPAVVPFRTFWTCALILFAWWLYFKINWLREGQTLPMRVWKIGLTDVSGCRPVVKRLLMRFVWTCVFVVFVPMLVYAVAQHFGLHGRAALGVALAWWILPWGFALFHARGQFLYDVLAGTELVDLREYS
ncbi:RDD family protein [Kingella negevensis]|uniref:RDD family protein n=1 Tax=Kingella negevensis TaxID=1522312 RepID=UPI0032B26431